MIKVDKAALLVKEKEEWKVIAGEASNESE